MNPVLQNLIDLINGLDHSVFKNDGMVKALTNKINAILATIDQGYYGKALEKLRSDVLGKTDGCAASGAPDKNDWIKTCGDQARVYSLVMEAIRLLERM